ncbi:small ribosomal subunit protein mS25 isoform X4 [Pan paniscus]|uniref:small ribosomal subunit protein mS25 isoform X4 n=1 Tax=Pan paniscus TaxID=9597 RepID=UPI001561671C|nr:28S ribosomal protein S25, mitochondrial isoform X4 [Pan paniscus]
MPMKGRFPIRRTLQYLSQGNVVFKDSVKVMTVNYNTHGELGEGARKFVFFNIPQIQYKNPWVQIMMFKNMTPSPFLRFYLEMGSYYFAQAGLEHLGSSDPRAFASQGVYRHPYPPFREITPMKKLKMQAEKKSPKYPIGTQG